MKRVIAGLKERGWFRFPKVYVLACAAGLLLALPGLWTGIFIDDYIHVATLMGLNPDTTQYDMFRFVTIADADQARELMGRGPMPWWTSIGMKARFCRPLSSALIVADNALFGKHYFWWHAHSLVWYAALIVAFGMLVRRVLPEPVAALALLLFAINDTHWFPAVWLANRNAMVATVPALLGLVAHLAWRERNWRPGAPLSLLGFAVGLTGGETALGVVGYLAAYEFFAGPRAISNTEKKHGLVDFVRGGLLNVRWLLPLGTLLVAYFVAYKHFGFGAQGSGTYIDPVGEPVEFLKNMPARFLALLGALLVRAPVDAWVISLRAHIWIAGAGAVGVVLFAGLIRKYWCDFDPPVRRALCWTVPGLLVSMLPVTATFPATRLLLLPSMGCSILLAALIYYWWINRGVRKGSRLVSIFLWFLLISNIAFPVIMWPLESFSFGLFGNISHAAYMNAEIDDSRVAGQRVILLVAPDPLTAIYPGVIRMVEGHPKPASFFSLSLAPYPHRLVRTAGNRFELEVVGGAMMTTEFEKLFRNPKHTMPKGYTADMNGIKATVLEVDERGPTHVAFDFDRPIDDPSLYFMVWKDKGLRHVVLPPVGGVLELPQEIPFF